MVLTVRRKDEVLKIRLGRYGPSTMMLNPRPAHLALRRADARGREDAPAASVTGSGRAAPPVAGVALRIAHAADGGFLVSDVASSPARDTTDGLIRPGDALLAVDGQPVPIRQSPRHCFRERVSYGVLMQTRQKMRGVPCVTATVPRRCPTMAAPVRRRAAPAPGSPILCNHLNHFHCGRRARTRGPE